MKLFLIGGRPCSGKTTLATQLGKKYNIAVNHLDTFAQEYINKSTEQNSYLYRWKNVNLIELFQTNPTELFVDYIRTYEEMLPYLLQAIKNSKEKILILEGSILLPMFIDEIRKYNEVSICYLMTNDTFVRERYFARDYVQDMLCNKNGKIAIENLLNRDSIFSAYLTKEIKKHEYTNFQIQAEDVFEKNLKRLEDFFFNY